MEPGRGGEGGPGGLGCPTFPGARRQDQRSRPAPAGGRKERRRRAVTASVTLVFVNPILFYANGYKFRPAGVRSNGNLSVGCQGLTPRLYC